MTASPAPDTWGKAAIAQSWDQLVDDYKVFYHVRAQGGTLADLPKSLRKVPEQSKGPDAKSETSGSPPANDSSGDASAEALAGAEHGAEVETPVSGTSMSPAAEQSTAAAVDAAPPSECPQTNEPPVPSLMPPQMVLGNVENDNLKKLLMSWYYAGYYTGLYEGQQQAQQSKPKVDQHNGDAIQP